MQLEYICRKTNRHCLSYLRSRGVCTSQGNEVVIIGVVVLICKHQPSQIRSGQKQVCHNQLECTKKQLCKPTVEMVNMLLAVGKLVGLQNHRKLASDFKKTLAPKCTA